MSKNERETTSTPEERSAEPTTTDAATPGELAEVRAPGEPVKIADRKGMFGSSLGNDTSGYGGLDRPVLFPGAATKPYGSYFDELTGNLQVSLRQRGGDIESAVERVVVDRGELTLFVAREHLPLVAQVLRDEPALPAEPMTNPLADMAPAAPAHRKERAAKAEKSAKAEKAERKEAHAKAVHAKAQDKAREAAKDRKTKAKPGAAREQDSDVVLLAALMSHMDPKKGKATPAEQLASCRRYNAAGEEQCRARVCAAAGPKEPACKRVQAARTDSES